MYRASRSISASVLRFIQRIKVGKILLTVNLCLFVFDPQVPGKDVCSIFVECRVSEDDAFHVSSFNSFECRTTIKIDLKFLKLVGRYPSHARGFSLRVVRAAHLTSSSTSYT